MRQPKITVITLTYNLYSDDRVNLFKKCIESVQNQTYTNIEHIIIDGASNDGSLEIIEEYARKNGCKLYSEKDNGIDDAYNKGISKATGKYIAFLNSDDYYYDNDVISDCIEKLEDENADYSYGSEVKVDRKGNKIFESHPQMFKFWHDVPYGHQTLIVKKTVLEEIGLYDTSYGYGGDVALMLKLIIDGYKGIDVKRFVAKYTFGGNCTNHEDKKNLYKVFNILGRRFNELHRKFYPDITFEESERIYRFYQNKKVYPSLFLEKLINYIVSLDLKYFDYNTCIDYIVSIINEINLPDNKNNVKHFYLFGFIPIWKKVETCYKTKYYLFNFIPFLKVKKRIIKGGKK